MEQWYVLHVNPKKEAFVNGQLLDYEIETYFPYLQFERGYGRGIRIEPYFASYLFVHVDLNSPYTYALSSMPGVRDFVRFDGQPAIVPDLVMDSLRRRLRPYERKVLKKTEWLFKPGDKVLIAGGPLEGYEAIFERGKGSTERAKVLLKMLGTWTHAEIDVNYLKPLGVAGVR
jgi:transcriptional antiterminator RfaH